jgi:hypothetical protein
MWSYNFEKIKSIYNLFFPQSDRPSSVSILENRDVSGRKADLIVVANYSGFPLNKTKRQERKAAIENLLHVESHS